MGVSTHTCTEYENIEQIRTQDYLYNTISGRQCIICHDKMHSELQNFIFASTMTAHCHWEDYAVREGLQPLVP